MIVVAAAIAISLLCVLVVAAVVRHDRSWARKLAREIRALPETSHRPRERA